MWWKTTNWYRRELFKVLAENMYLKLLIMVLREELRHCQGKPVANSLLLAYTIDGVTFKSKHMSLQLSAGKQVILTVTGSAPDPNDSTKTVPAPVTGVSVSSSDGSKLAVTQNTDGTFTLKYVADGSGTIDAVAQNSLGSAVSASDPFTTGGTTPPPVVATGLNFSYSEPTPA